MNTRNMFRHTMSSSDFVSLQLVFCFIQNYLNQKRNERSLNTFKGTMIKNNENNEFDSQRNQNILNSLVFKRAIERN